MAPSAVAAYNVVGYIYRIAAIAINFRQLTRRVREQQRRHRRLLRIGHGLRGHKNKDCRRRSNLSVGLHRAVIYIVGRCFKPHIIGASDIIGEDGKYLRPPRGPAGGRDDERRKRDCFYTQTGGVHLSGSKMPSDKCLLVRAPDVGNFATLWALAPLRDYFNSVRWASFHSAQPTLAGRRLSGHNVAHVDANCSRASILRVPHLHTIFHSRSSPSQKSPP